MSQRPGFIYMFLILIGVNAFIFCMLYTHTRDQPLVGVVRSFIPQFSVKLLIIVPCRVDQLAERMRIRATYGQCSSRQSPTLRTVFYIGANASEVKAEQWRKFQEEQSSYDDIYMDSNVLDSDKNSSLKIIRALHWAFWEYPNVQFIMKVEVGVFVHLHNLLDGLTTVMQDLELPTGAAPPPIIIGRNNRQGGPIRNKNSKWYVSEEEYAQPMYPPYTNGHVYVLNAPAMKIILANHQRYVNVTLPCSVLEERRPCVRHRPMVSVEDVYITGILINGTNNFQRINHNGFHMGNGKPPSDAITVQHGWSQKPYEIVNCYAVDQTLVKLL